MVFYRKYRPQLISELDLTSVREKLTAILSSDNIPHAFLFAGPKGLGKTSSARILAKAVNCESRRVSSVSKVSKAKNAGDKALDTRGTHGTLDTLTIEPCNVCSACISITNGSAVDVLEIDAASNRGIDEIRDLRERIKFSPSSLKKKIYIIDEVHMLTTEAFNALLKTLEEPPAHVMFILATTETGKLPATIMSRVFLVQFEKPSKEEIARSLWRVARGEELDVSEEVLEKIGELSDGAFRDGVKILEELSLAAGGKKITEELLESLYKAGSHDNSVEKLLSFTLDKNVAEALKVIDILASQNADFKLIIEKMANVLHSRLLDYVRQNNTSETAEVKKLLGLLDEAYKGLKGAVLPQLPLEIAVMEFCILAPSNLPLATNNSEKRLEVVSQKPESRVTIPPATSHMPPANDNLETFKKLIDSVNLDNKILAGLLRGCKLEDVGETTAIFKAQSTFHLGKLSEPANKKILGEKLEEILGKTVAITVKS